MRLHSTYSDFYFQLFKKALEVLLVNEPDVGHDRSKLERSLARWSVRWPSRLQCLV